MSYFIIRVAVASAIMIAYHFTRGFHDKLETFVMAFAAALAAQGVAFGVKLAVGDQARNKRAAALLAGCVVLVAASVVFIVYDKTEVREQPRVHGILDMSSMKRDGDAHEFIVVEAGKRVTVRYRGTLPDQLRDRTEILAKGQWQGDVFVAADVMARCPSSYNTPTGPVPATQYR